MEVITSLACIGLPFCGAAITALSYDLRVELMIICFDWSKRADNGR